VPPEGLPEANQYATSVVALLVISMFVFGILGGVYADVYRRQGPTGFFMGFFLSVFGVLLIVALPDKRRKCPDCWSTIDDQSKRCPFCRKRLPEITVADHGPRKLATASHPMSRPSGAPIASVAGPSKAICGRCKVKMTPAVEMGETAYECPRCGARS
jgi:uncharacterized paraquat-inducible protein A